MNRVFVDTSAWYAFARADDPDHEEVKAALERWEGRLLTSNFVFDEVVTLALSRLGHRHAVAIGRALRDGAVAEFVRATAEDEGEAWRFFARRADKGYSFTDCVSFSIMRRLRIESAVTTDRHFAQAGFRAEP